MAVGGEGMRLLASESYDKRLKVGQVVQYWSTSKGKWMDAVVQNVDSSGAVQVSVKPRAWLNQQEQSTKIRSSLPTKSAEQLADGKPTEVISHSSQQPENGKYTNGSSTHGGTNGIDSRPADMARSDNRSRALYSLFSEWDKTKGAARNGCATATGRIPPAGLRQELKVFKESEKDIRQYKLFLLQQPQRCVRKRVTSLLWTTFYNKVREKCAQLRQQPDRRSKVDSAAGSNSTRTSLEADFTAALEEAETCLQHIRAEVREKVASANNSQEDAERLEAHREILAHLHIMLADLERYRATSGTADSKAALARAEKLYCASLSSCSELGQAFNQRGLVAAHQGNKLKAVRCGFHSMLCAIRFPKSEQNLLVWLGQVAEDVAAPQSVVDRLRGTPVVPNCSRAAQGAVCQLQLTLLQQREGASSDLAQRQSDVGELINKAQAKMKEAVTSMEIDNQSRGSDPDMEWILEILMISMCAAAYHRRGQPQAKPTVLDKLMDGYASTAFWAWDWVVRLGLCLAEEAKEGSGDVDQPSPLLAPLSLLCLLATLLVPHSWRSSVTEKLQDALRNLQIGSEEQPEDEGLLRLALPEDKVAAGLLPVPESDVPEGSRAAAPRASEDEASEDEVVLQTPVVKVASPEKKAQSPDAELSTGSQTGSRSLAPPSLQTQVRRARLSFCLRVAAEGAAKEVQPAAPPPRGPESLAPMPAAEDCGVTSWGGWGDGNGWAQGYDGSGWPAWGNDEWGDGWAETQMDEGQTLEELGEEPDLWDMPDTAAAGDPQWSGYGYAPLPLERPPVAPGYNASAAWLAGAQEAWYGMAPGAPPALTAAPPGILSGLGCLGPPPGLARPAETHADLRPEADGCHLPMVDLAFLDEDADAEPKPSFMAPSVLGAGRRPPPPSCLPPPPPRGH